MCYSYAVYTRHDEITGYRGVCDEDAAGAGQLTGSIPGQDRAIEVRFK